MILYKVTGKALNLAGGRVKLSRNQADSRMHRLEMIKEPTKKKLGEFEITSPIQFKNGEMVWYDGQDINKALAEQVEELAAKKKA